jgi:hypothetical protein
MRKVQVEDIVSMARQFQWHRGTYRSGCHLCDFEAAGYLDAIDNLIRGLELGIANHYTNVNPRSDLVAQQPQVGLNPSTVGIIVFPKVEDPHIGRGSQAVAQVNMLPATS